MGILKSLKRKKTVQTVASVTNKFLLIDQLKQNKLLETTDCGVFYTFKEVLTVNKDPNNMLKQFYVYARTTGLLQQGEVLQIKERTSDNKELLLATILADSVTLFDLTIDDNSF